MKANQLVSEVYYQGFNTDLEGVGAEGGSGFKEPADLSVAQSLMQISGRLETCTHRWRFALSCSHNKIAHVTSP